MARPIRAQQPAVPEHQLLRRERDATPYRLYVPPAQTRQIPLPLVLFLHGGGGRGSDNEQQLGEGNGMLVRLFLSDQRTYPAFVIAPQTRTRHDSDHILRIVDEVRRQYRVDPDRIYVVGQSLGGYGIIDLLGKRPRFFAAAVFIAGDAAAPGAPRLATVPTWIFHGEHDSLFPATRTRALVDSIRTRRGRVRYTEFTGEGHGLAWLVVREKEIVPWLFKQRLQ